MMEQKPVKEEHYGVGVWVNKKTEPLRKSECLCLNCNSMKDKCDFASEFFDLCKTGNIALMVTRCKNFTEMLPQETTPAIKSFKIDFYDAFDGWGESDGTLGDIMPNKFSFATLEEAKAKVDELMKNLDKNNKGMGEHFSVIKEGKEVYRGR